MHAAISLLDLPAELLVHVLSHLPGTSLLDCRLVHPTLQHAVDSSAVLQYIVELAATGFEDNASPTCPLVVGDRLHLLKAQESAWRTLDFGQTVSVSVRHKSSSIYDLTGGVFLLGENNDPLRHRTDALNFIRLPSSDDADVYRGEVGEDAGEGCSAGVIPFDSPWSKIDIKSKLIDVGLAVQEHDLIAVVTYSFTLDPSDAPQLAFDIHLLKLSTGAHHPRASKPVIRVSEVRATAGLCSISIEIVGNVLGILLNFPIPLVEQPAEFYVIDWTTGDVLMERQSPPRSYNAFAFLSEDVIVLPNSRQNFLELCPIRTGRPAHSTSSDSTTPLAPLPLQTACTLALPRLSPYFAIYRLLCRSEPNPHTEPHLGTSKPFHPSAREAIIIFNFFLRNHLAYGTPQCFSLIVHRATLLEQLTALLPLSSPGSGIAPDTSLTPIPWASWGPPKSRWFAPSGLANRWITTTCGQRHAVIGFDLSTERDEDEFDAPITVLDFNQLALRRYVSQRQRGEDGGEAGSEVDIEVVDYPTEFKSPLFTEPIVSALPYMRVTTRKTYDYESVLMDEDRIIGLKLESDNISELVVHCIRTQ